MLKFDLLEDLFGARKTIPSLSKTAGTFEPTKLKKERFSGPCPKCGEPLKGHSRPNSLCQQCTNQQKILASTTPCKICGKPVYVPPKHRKRGNGQFCSLVCSGKAETGAGNHRWTGGKVEIACRRCGKFSRVDPSVALHKYYCSHSCSSKNTWDRRGRDLPAPCEECGKLIKKGIARQKKVRFCSKACKDIAHAKEMRDERNPRFVHGNWRRGYGSGWTKSRKLAVRQRDGFICRVCSLPEAAHGTALHIHHINYNKDDMDLNNLISACRNCHGRMHGNLSERGVWKNRLSLLLSASVTHPLLTTST